MINLEEIQSRLDRGVASLVDTHDLLCEVERLRKHRESCMDNLKKGYETGMDKERHQVVQYLRYCSTLLEVSDLEKRSFQDFAIGIENREHWLRMWED
jgi:hypothetical protein